MKHVLVAAAATICLIAGAAQGQGHQTGSANPAVKDGAPHHVATPAEGANSFTADQAHGRLEKAGFTKISKLTKKEGLWSGTAVKEGKKSAVMLDFKGNITTR